jgi:hypothetical protein
VQIADGSHCDRTAIANGSQTDVRLTHPRLELERQAVEAHKQKKSEAGKKGNDARWGSQTDRKPIAEGIANGSQTHRKTIAPNPSLLLPSTKEKEKTHTQAEDDFRKPGWAADEWARFVVVWNQTPKATPWPHLIAPSGWVDYASYPDWLERARLALERLPRCEFFDTPVAVTKFFEYVDKILAGEFDNAKHDARKRRQPAGGNL